ncbi:MAG: transglycosylase SLT domain-containing protein [Thermoleophilia bacterium]|nr:transglycosylase SLT domain-containing protein [Thermoleophilia bacterium]
MTPRKHHWKPGLGAILAMAFALVLAHGVPGVASESPSQHFTNAALAQQLKQDAIVTPLPESPEDQQLQETVRKSEAKAAAQAKRKHRAQPLTRKQREFTRDYRSVALRAAQRAHIRNPWMFVRQMAAESGFQPCVRSGAGAIGIAQIMPATARGWDVDPYNADAALTVAAQHMARYEKQYGSYKLALAAYNAGPGAVKSAGMRVPAYSETQNYVHKILDRSYPLPGMRQVYHLPGGLQAGFGSRLKALQQDVKRHGGGRLVINEGWRSYENSAHVWKLAKKQHHGWQGAVAWAAPPGCSNHSRGQAADLKKGRALNMAHKLAANHGLIFPMAREPWHIERAGIKTQSG